ncbi:MAG: type II secretion system protein [Patescibacteria group bacterium]
MKNNRGFTLIELLIVIGILATIMGIAVTSFTGMQRNARDLRRREDIDTINTALQIYRKQHEAYPVADTYAELETILLSEGYITSQVNDPLAGQAAGYAFNYESDDSGSSYVLWAQLEKKESGNNLYYRASSTGATETVNPPSAPAPTSAETYTQPYASPTAYTPG